MDNHLKTISYYDQNAESFVGTTAEVDFREVQDRFLNYVPVGGKILDFGCGSGRDTKYFLEKGYQVDACDGSEEMCKRASAYTGIEVKRMMFSELDAEHVYDGIWACASILHLPKEELHGVISKMIQATKLDGYIYMSFKYGDFEGEQRGRYFTHFTEKSFASFTQDIFGMTTREEWVSEDVRPGRENEKWLNLIVRNETDLFRYIGEN